MSDFYKDSSRILPSSEDLSLHKKKQDLKRLLLSNRSADGSSNNEDDMNEEEASLLLLADPIISKRGRGNRRVTKNNTNDVRNSSPAIRFIGIMGTNFPARLHDLLTLSFEELQEREHDDHNKNSKESLPISEDATRTTSISRVISWLPHGRAWRIHDKEEFIKSVSRSHFNFTKYESFIRQVNAWGFKRVTRGKDVNSYYHEMFLRDMPHLVQSIKRNKAAASSNGGRGALSLRRDPDFYAMDKNKPLLNYYDPPLHHYKNTTPQGSSSSFIPFPLELFVTRTNTDEDIPPVHDKNPHDHDTRRCYYPRSPSFPLIMKKTSSSSQFIKKISLNKEDEEKDKLMASLPRTYHGGREANRDHLSLNISTMDHQNNPTRIVGTRRKFGVLLHEPTKQHVAEDENIASVVSMQETTPPRRGRSKRAKMVECCGYSSSQMSGTRAALISPSPKSQEKYHSSFSFNRKKDDDDSTTPRGRFKIDPRPSESSSELLNEVARIFEKNDEVCFDEDLGSSFTAPQEEIFFDSLCLPQEFEQGNNKEDDEDEVLINFLENLFDEEEEKVKLAATDICEEY